MSLPPPLWAHQRDAARFADKHDGTILGMGLGTGKSKVAIALCEHWQARRVLIICPTTVLRVWPGQFDTHASQSWTIVNGLRVNARGRIVPLTVAQRLEQARQAVASNTPAAIVVNYESFYREPLRSWLLLQQFDVIIYDEAHRLKAAGGKQSWMAVHLRSRARRRLALTGTPLSQGPWDVYALARALDPSVFGSSKQRFIDHYFECDKWDNPQGFLPEAERVFAQHLSRLMFSCSSDVLELPPALDLPPRYVTLGKAAQDAHDALDASLHARLESGNITTQIVLTAMLRMSQLAGGHAAVDTDGGSETVVVDDSKRRALADVLKEVDRGPVVVFCRFVAELDTVRSVAVNQGLRYAEISGRDKNGLSADGQMSNTDLLGVQYQAGGQGVNLTRARGAVWFSPTFSLIDYEQSRGRLHRPGQTEPVWYLRLVAQGAIDELIWDSVDRGGDAVADTIARARNAALAAKAG